VSGEAGPLLIDSNTGIEVALPVAGPGARAYAFIVDWHARLILAIAWYVGGAFLYNGQLSLSPPAQTHAWWFGAVALPAGAIYLLYHPVLEVALRGSTPGKRLAGVHIVNRAGGAASAGALLVRNVFRLVDSLPACYGVGLITVALSRDNLRWGDMAAGTVLVYQRSEAAVPLPARAAHAPALETHTAELVFELLQRWDSLEAPARASLARQLLARAGAADPGAAAGDGDLRAQLEILAARA
jgi:uncharacterized RDD family membrane protein YckC